MVTADTATAAAHIYDLSGGALCLDFANTVSNRGSDAPIDRLLAYGDLLAWSEQSRAATPAQVRDLARLAAAHPSAARDALNSSRIGGIGEVLK